MKWKIIADSGCDYRSLDNLAPDTEFVSVPLTIQVGETIYRDDAQLNIDQMMEKCMRLRLLLSLPVRVLMII